MGCKLIAVFLTLAIFSAAPSVATAQLPSVVSNPLTQSSSPNPLFPERIGIPWLLVPQVAPHPQTPSGPEGSLQSPALSQIPSITNAGRQQFPLPFSSLRPEIVYVGNVPILVSPLPLPPNSIVARLKSYGFLLQVPMIPSPIGNSRDR
jgi:hypothetical protein